MEKKQKSGPLNQRVKTVLKNLVDCYIRDGQPVGSKRLAEESELMLSPATIRKIMADLEAAGYLHSPHHSAGRIPTVPGYRLFVDNCLTIQLPAEQEIKKLREQFAPDGDIKTLVSEASSLLSRITELAGIVTLPRKQQPILKHVEFLPLSEQRVLVILVLNEHEVQNRVIHTEREYSKSELEQAGNYLTQYYAGKNLLNARKTLLRQMRKSRQDLEQMLKVIMEIAEKSCQEEDNNGCVIAGEANLFAAVEADNYQNLQSLFEAFSQKRGILHLLNCSLQAKGIKIFIGEESGHEMFDDYSVITAPYLSQGKVVGVLGVIGPTRMRYHHVISAVDVTSKLLSQALTG